ncbi:MAG: MerR family transcriptional regulator [Lachnospiraceae bacterium]|nr:MerR family transcriptional regulator [Lachnospiraceae bacterium]
MKDRFSIQEISKIFGVPKSTLRYWDQEGLIHLERNEENHYREFSIMTMYEIIDIITYRALRMPIEDIRKVETGTPEFLRHTLAEKEKELDDQIAQLIKTKEKVKRKQEHFEEYISLLTQPYQIKTPDTAWLMPFHFQDKSHWDACMSDSYHFSLYFSPCSYSPLYGLAVIREEDQNLRNPEEPLLWSSASSKNEYLRCLLKVSYDDHSVHDLSKHHDYIRTQLNKTPGVTIARHLFTAYETKRCDYYKAFIELL